jgi:enamine deaminase RidA (YjgF/YER057c/UK114 family)
MNRELAPTTIALPAANYALAIATTEARAWLHTSGVLGTRPDGSISADIGEQAEEIWRSIAALLAEGGFEITDLVSYTTYVVHGNDLSTVMAARDAALGAHRAASTLIPVPALARSEWLMEIAVVAAR